MTLTVHPRQPADEEAAARESFELVERFRNGDQTAAFTEIYRRFHRQVYVFVLHRVGTRELAEDLTQDVFVRALRRVHTVQWQGKSLAAYLITIARNLCMDYYKSGFYRLETLTVDGELLGADSDRVSQEPQPEEAALGYLAGRDMLSALLELTEDQQDVLIMRFLRGLSVSETAAAMGKNEGAVKAVQYRASRALFKAMAAAGQLEDLAA